MNLSDVVFYFVLPVIVAVYFFLKKRFSYFEDRNIPFIKPTSWIFGSVTDVGRKINMADFMKSTYEATKTKDVIAGFFSLIEPVIVVNDFEVVKNITIKDFNNFADRPMYVNEENESITGNLFSIGGEKWRILRNKFSPAFTSGKIKFMCSAIFEKSDNLVQAIEKASRHGSVEAKKLATRYTVDVISSCAFGFEANTLNNENMHILDILAKSFGEEGGSQLRFLFLSAFPKFAKFFNIRLFDKIIQKFFDEVVSDSITYREKNNVVKQDFLNTLIQLKNKKSLDGEKTDNSSRNLTMPECIAQAFIFFLGGADTSSYTISYAMAQLGMHPEIQEKLRKEINEKTASSNGELNYDNIQEMTYLNQIVNETLRKHPPAPLIFRDTTADYKVPNSKHIIEKGTQVMVPIMGFHHDSRYWKNPEKFDPEHFSPEEIAKRPNLAFMPFGEGPRNCIGMRFALINVKTAVAILIKNFNVTLDTTKTKYPLKLNTRGLNMSIEGGCWVKFDKI